MAVRIEDNHPYSTLSKVFEDNRCMQIDDITCLSVESIKLMAELMGISASIGLVNRICAYALSDVATVQRTGKMHLEA